jgi:lysophospholipid acyltransferase (LPLAT)-like uncharacterized protein
MRVESVPREDALKDRIIFWIISRSAALLILLLGHTWRIRWFGREHVQAARQNGGNVIYAFWHGRMLALCFSHRRRLVHIMVSEHRDGEMIARTVERLGFVPVRGSTTRGGLRALFQMADRIAAGYDVAITPDGPRGPRFQVQQGVITLAQRTGMPIVPVANSASLRKTLSSWDRYIIPLPFSRVAIMHGEPISVPRQLSPQEMEKKRIQLQLALQALTLQADELMKPDDRR